MLLNVTANAGELYIEAGLGGRFGGSRHTTEIGGSNPMFHAEIGYCGILAKEICLAAEHKSAVFDEDYGMNTIWIKYRKSWTL